MSVNIVQPDTLFQGKKKSLLNSFKIQINKTVTVSCRREEKITDV